MKPDCEDIKIAIGFYGNRLHTIDFTRGSDGDAYMMLHQNETELTFQEKPGIGCLSHLVLDNKALIVCGSFDHRIRMVSARTLKMLVQLSFH